MLNDEHKGYTIRITSRESTDNYYIWNAFVEFPDGEGSVSVDGTPLYESASEAEEAGMDWALEAIEDGSIRHMR